jgi:hypothetical protein
MLILAHQSPRVRDPLFGDRLHLLQKVRDEKAPANPTILMMLGSSRAANGFNAALLERHLETKTGKSYLVFNFGTVGTGPIMSYLYLQRLLKLGIKPDLLLIEVYPIFLTDEGANPYETSWAKGDRFYIAEIETAEAYGIPCAEINSTYREILLNPFGELRWQIMSRVKPTWTPQHIGYFWARQTDNRGWTSLFPPTRTEEQRQQSIIRTRSDIGGVYCAKEFGGPAVQLMRDLARLCLEHGIEMRWIIMPESSSFLSWYAPNAEARLNKLRASLSQDDVGPWIDARLWVPDDQFADGHHLLPAGAETFTKRLERELFPEIPAKSAD